MVGELRADVVDFANQGIHVGGDGVLLSCVGVEVAVGAAMDAEGNVEIEGSVGCHVSIVAWNAGEEGEAGHSIYDLRLKKIQCGFHPCVKYSIAKKQVAFQT